jgi:hypothetical protein
MSDDKSAEAFQGLFKRLINDISHFKYSPHKGINFQKIVRKGIN